MPLPSRPTRAALAATIQEVDAALVAAFPSSITSTDLIERFGPCAKSRIGDLRRAGRHIRTGSSGGVAAYRLVDLGWHAPDPTLAGLIIRYGGARGWTVRSHDVDGTDGVPSAVRAEAQAAAMAAYTAIVGPYLPRPALHLVDAEDPIPEVEGIWLPHAPAGEDLSDLDDLIDQLAALKVGGGK